MENPSLASIFERFQQLEQKRIEDLQEACATMMSRQQEAQQAYLSAVTQLFNDAQPAYQEKARELALAQLKGEVPSAPHELQDMIKDFYSKLQAAQQQWVKAMQESWTQGEQRYRQAAENYFKGVRDVWTDVDPATMSAAMMGGARG